MKISTIKTVFSIKKAIPIFNYLLVGYTAEEFQKSELYRKLIGWIQVNVGITI